jgi:hypothetical protein
MSVAQFGQTMSDWGNRRSFFTAIPGKDDETPW